MQLSDERSKGIEWTFSISKYIYLRSIEKLRNKLIHFSNQDIILTHIASYMRQKNHIFILDMSGKVIKALNKYKIWIATKNKSNIGEQT